jgi:hypothetical protein
MILLCLTSRAKLLGDKRLSQSKSAVSSKFGTSFKNPINARADLKSVWVVKASSVRGVFAIKASACVPERFFFARRFSPPQVVKGGAVLRVNKKHPPRRA